MGLSVSYAPSAAQLAADVAFGSRVVKRKSADETVTSSTTLQDDNELNFAVGTNEQWVAVFHLYVTCTSAAADFKAAVSAPASTTGKHSLVGPARGNTVVDGDATILSFGTITTALSCGVTASGSAAPAYMLYTVSIATTNSGTLQLQWAQDASNAAGTTLQTGSWLEAIRGS